MESDHQLTARKVMGTKSCGHLELSFDNNLSEMASSPEPSPTLGSPMQRTQLSLTYRTGS